MTDLDPNHPAMIQGRRHCRDVLGSAARVVRIANDARKADATSTLSTALQLMLTTALVDEFDPQEVYGALSGALAWAVLRLPAEDQVGVLTAMTAEVVSRMELAAPVIEGQLVSSTH